MAEVKNVFVCGGKGRGRGGGTATPLCGGIVLDSHKHAAERERNESLFVGRPMWRGINVCQTTSSPPLDSAPLSGQGDNARLKQTPSASPSPFPPLSPSPSRPCPSLHPSLRPRNLLKKSFSTAPVAILPWLALTSSCQHQPWTTNLHHAPVATKPKDTRTTPLEACNNTNTHAGARARGNTTGIVNSAYMTLGLLFLPLHRSLLVFSQVGR